MKFPDRILSMIVLGIFLAGFLIAGNASELGAIRLRVDRWSSAGEPADFGESLIQQIAQQMGVGHFFVRDVVIDDSMKSRLFSVYPATTITPAAAPARCILCRRTKNGDEMIVGNAEEIVPRYFMESSGSSSVDEFVLSTMPRIVSAIFYGANGQWWIGGDESLANRGLVGLDKFNPERHSELRSILSVPKMKRDSMERIFWEGRYLRCDGGIDEVSVTLPLRSGDHAILQRVELRPSGFFPASPEATSPFEQWMVVNESSWRPPQRYKMMVMMAALGNAPKQFQLATALLQEPNEAAKIEGVKWLQTAAAQGYRDAIDLLEQSRDQLVRSDRDRDKVRLSRCCPVPGR